MDTMDTVEPSAGPAEADGQARRRRAAQERARDDVLVATYSGLIVAPGTPPGAPPQEVLIGHGAAVSGRDGPVGKVDHLLVDPDTDEVRGIVVHGGPRLAQDVLVPAGSVERVAEGAIVLGATAAQIARWPAYGPVRCDWRLSAAVRTALDTDARTLGERNIQVHTASGVVHLRGVVQTEGAVQAATEIARHVHGVYEVVDELCTEDALAATVRTALARDPRTARAALTVHCVGWRVTLSGSVRSAEERAAALEVAASVANVRTVRDDLQVAFEAPGAPRPGAAGARLWGWLARFRPAGWGGRENRK